MNVPNPLSPDALCSLSTDDLLTIDRLVNRRARAVQSLASVTSQLHQAVLRSDHESFMRLHSRAVVLREECVDLAQGIAALQKVLPE